MNKRNNGKWSSNTIIRKSEKENRKLEFLFLFSSFVRTYVLDIIQGGLF